jgi:hypothetical protein
MVKALLIRGMLAGAIAAVIAFGFAYVFAEPAIEYAIGFEEQAQAAEAAHAHVSGETHEHENEAGPVSRGTQATFGLLTALAIYGSGIGGMLAIVFALAYGRMGKLGPRATALLLAAAGFVSMALVPFLKYPANPPAVGQPETLGSRTALFLTLIAVTIAAVMLAIAFARWLAPRLGAWAALPAGGAAFIAVVAAACVLLPAVQEVPGNFSPEALWHFRIASLGVQFLLWAALGLLFGALARRILQPGKGVP